MTLEQNQNPETPQQQNTNPEAPPTNAQPAAVAPTPQQPETSNQLNNLTLAALRESEEARYALQRQIDELRNTPQQPQFDSQRENERFMQDPMGAVNDRVQHAVQQTIAPIAQQFQQFIQGQQNQTAYQQAKNHFKGLPYWDKVEAILDQHFNNNPNVPPTVQNIQAAYQYLIGNLALQGQLAPTQPAAPQQQPINTPNLNTMQPAQIPPSPPSPPINPGSHNNMMPQLTELEKRLARENGLSDADYIKLRDADQRDVVKIDASWRAK